MLDADELLARLVDRSQQLVELGLHCCGVAVLAVLNQEDHQESDNGGAGVDHQLPSVGIMEERAGCGPNDDHADGSAEGYRMACPSRGLGCAPVEETPHPAVTRMKRLWCRMAVQSRVFGICGC